MDSRAMPRAVRSVAVGAAGAGLAISAHSLAGGGGPALATAGAAWALLAAAAWAAARGPLGDARLIGLLGGAQAVLHVLFAVAQPAAGHAHHAGPAASAPSPGAEGAMVVAHLAATLALAVLLRRAEDWLFRAGRVVVDLARRLRPRARPSAGAPVSAVRVHRAPHVALPARRPLAGAASRRGPPVAASPLA